MTIALPLGTHVAFTGDERITGIVVGFGALDNALDPASTDDRTHHVVIVALDAHARNGWTTHHPFDESVLKVAETIVTEDGVRITQGMRAWNYYDLEWVTVGPIDTDGWSHCTTDEGRVKSLNGQRLASKEIRPRTH